MFMPMLIAAFALAGQSAQTLECGNLITKTSETWPDWAGGKVSLTVHTEDDRAKDSHQCMSQYTLRIVRPDGTSTDSQVYSVIDDWGRPIKFWISGVSPVVHRLIATIIEGESWQLLVYDLNAPHSSPAVYVFSKGFLPKLSSSCRQSLGVVGLTQSGNPVIAGNDAACTGEAHKRWKVKQDAAEQYARALPMPQHDVIVLLAPRRPPTL